LLCSEEALQISAYKEGNELEETKDAELLSNVSELIEVVNLQLLIQWTRWYQL